MKLKFTIRVGEYVCDNVSVFLERKRVFLPQRKRLLAKTMLSKSDFIKSKICESIYHVHTFARR